jgi:DNA-binding LacI/PurR family transcriptional regulator
MDAVRAAIDAGTFKPGDRVPSTKVLAEEMAVSLVTVHRAMQELVAHGVLRRGQGRGTFVHESYTGGGGAERRVGDRLGVVFHRESSLADAYHGQILEGVRRQADDLGMDLVLLRFGEDWRNECRGYIYVNPFPEQLEKPPRFGKAVRKGKQSRPPTIVVGARSTNPEIFAVDTDNFDLARRAVSTLVGLGHKRIGFVGGAGQVSNDIDRYRGFCEASQQHGLKVDAGHVVRQAGWKLGEFASASLINVLRSPERPTAFFAAGYYFALDVYAAARACGLTIPGDVSVIGVDDPPSASHLSPALTTFAQPLLKLGRIAVEELYEQVYEGERAPQQITMSAELVVRGSAAAPGGADGA